MTHGEPRDPNPRSIEHARDLQTKLYREIGISAVAAALRFTTRPDTTAARGSSNASKATGRDGLAA